MLAVPQSYKVADVYAFGMVIFETFTNGGIPFEDVPEVSILHEVCYEQARPKRTTDMKDLEWSWMEKYWHVIAAKRGSFEDAAANIKNRRMAVTPSVVDIHKQLLEAHETPPRVILPSRADHQMGGMVIPREQKAAEATSVPRDRNAALPDIEMTAGSNVGMNDDGIIYGPEH